MKWYLNKNVSAGFIVFAIINIVLGIASYSYVSDLFSFSRKSAANHQIILENERLRSLTLSLHNRATQFMLTRKQTSAQEYKAQLTDLSNHLKNFSFVTDVTVRNNFDTLRSMLSALPQTAEEYDTARHEAVFSRMFTVFERQQTILTDLQRDNQIAMTGKIRGFAAVIIALLAMGLITPSVLAYFLNRNLKAKTSANEKLKNAYNIIGDLYDKSPSGYFIVDHNGMIINMNETLLRWLSYRREEVVDRLHIDQLLEDHELLMQRFSAQDQEFLGKEIVSLAFRSDRSLLPVAVNTMFTEGKEAKSRALRCAVFDNTKRNEAEQESKALLKELDAFSYSVSHDLRAPLRSINGYAQILIEDYGDTMDTEMRRLLEVISNNGKRMGNLIDDLLHFSKMGRTELLTSSINMNDMVTSIVSELREQGSYNKAKVDIEILGDATGDPSMIRQVWVNLISNALKYSAKKSNPHIQIGRQEENNRHLFFVKDNGAGFDMIYASKLFGVFSRLHRPEDFEGTGVGLALVKRIMDRHRGKIWAEGKVGEGATFFFSLPKG